MINSKKVKIHFDSLSTMYQYNYSQIKSGKTHEFCTRLQLVVNSISPGSGNLLDCACGTGEITSHVLVPGGFTTAILCDISGAMLDIAKTKMENVNPSTALHYKKIDIFEYKPDSDMKFDVILCLGLVAHTGALEVLLPHLKSLLKTDGKIILQSSLATHWGIRFTRFFTAARFKNKHGYDLSYFTLKDIESHVRLSGLTIDRCQRYNFSFPFGDKISKMGNYWIEVLTEQFSAKYGSDAIFVISHQKTAVVK